MPKGAVALHSGGATTPVSSTQDNRPIALTVRARGGAKVIEKCLIFGNVSLRGIHIFPVVSRYGGRYIVKRFVVVTI